MPKQYPRQSYADVFYLPNRILPKSNDQVVGIDFSQSQIAGRHDHIPKPHPTQGGRAVLEHIREMIDPLSTGEQWSPSKFRARWGK